MTESPQSPPGTYLPDLPEPQVVSERLAQCVRESKILRQLLRVSMKANQERKLLGARKEATRAAS